ncbi:MAG: DUF2235 domain-containing protein [Vicinamibacterales bacterium]
MRSSPSILVRCLCLVALLLASACSAPPPQADPLNQAFDSSEPITAERLGAELAARAGRDAAQDVAYLVAGAMISRCDDPRDGFISTPAERTCLATLSLDDAWQARLDGMLATPPAISEPGWFTTLLLIAALLLALPWAVDRSVRITGWRLRQFTTGKWFRLHPLVQLLVAVVAGGMLYGAALLTLFAMNVQWSEPAAPLQRLVDLYHLATPEIRLLGVVAGLGILYVWFGMVDASRRITGLVGGATGTSTPLPGRRTPRNIVICCDGTGNRAEAVDGGRRAVSNVRKFFEVAKSDVESEWLQDKWYDDGVGTGTSGESKTLSTLEKVGGWLAANTPAKVLGVLGNIRAIGELAFGIGITENITQGYAQLVRMYQPGDRIFIVGFSRGAYTARCIADVIDDVGLLRQEYVRFAPDIIQLYRYRESPDETVTVRPDLLHTGVQIEFLGLWDTVASLGVPLWGWSFSIFKLWSNAGFGVTCIRNCKVIRHALSMDEQRSQFFPTLFDEATPQPGQDIQQRWFRGSHAGVGGGYADTSLSDIALGWMIEEARTCGLILHDAWDRTVLKRTDQDFYPNPIGQVITELERQKAWRVSGAWPRWHPCEVEQSLGYGVLDETVQDRAKKSRSLRAADAPVCSDELVTLAPGERATVRLLGHLGWNRTGVVMTSGATYRITYVGGVWQDKEMPSCGPAGQDPAGPGDLRRFLGWGRRVKTARWMELIGHVAHPRQWPNVERGGLRLLYYLLFREPTELTRSLIPLGRHLKAVGDAVDVTVNASGGVFHGYANDWWLAYDNNSGSVTLSVQRLDDTMPPLADRYVVAADGGVLDGREKPVGL